MAEDDSPAPHSEQGMRSEADEAIKSSTALTPDFGEEEYSDELDNVVPTRGYQMIPVVGLGGSAGAIQTLIEFFTLMPSDSGLVFVVVLHLSPEYESSLASLFQRVTKMPVIAVEDGAEVKPNHVYVIPPGKHLASADGHLRLTRPQEQLGRRMAVDIFFRTLAETHGPHAAAIILSGADGDGAIGLKRIKERGGLTIAQDPSEAEFTGMPQSAIETGMVDWVLKVQEMPGRLMDYIQHEKNLSLPKEEGPSPTEPLVANGKEGENEKVLRDILVYLRSRTGRDFSYYKRATILRRIARRLQVNSVETLPDYLAFLRTHPGEAGALLQDLLISVTNFFRDGDAFRALEAVIPRLFRGKGPNDFIRVWCPACATGEEAYSIAMLLTEHARTLDAPPGIQVFATDLDDEVIQKGRDGIFPSGIGTDVSDDRLQRFFVQDHRGYRIRRDLREGVLFALHDLLKDSPFSRLDLVSCRNLLIYLNPDAQRRALDIFHFALRPEGALFLGASESIDDATDLFSPLDKKHRIFLPRPVSRRSLPVPIGPSALALSLKEKERAERPGHLRNETFGLAPANWRGLELGNRKDASWEDLNLQIYERYGPASLIVDEQYEIVHLSALAARYLQFNAGEPSRNLMRTVHPMLRVEMHAALYRASQSRRPTEIRRLAFAKEEKNSAVNIQITPVDDANRNCFLIVFSEETDISATSPRVSPAEEDPIALQLERELEEFKDQMRNVVEQHDAFIEEQRAGNEELQAINEELRSATEELETGREELQSINEELTTVNQELKGKLDELGHSNSDLHNLMNATAIATVFLDRELRISRYTPTAIALFNFISSDIGRPLSDLQHHLDYPQLSADAQRVLDRLIPVEREVSALEGRSYLARLLPYRSLEDRIGGVVLTLVDITERRRAEESLRQRNDELERFNRIAVGRELRMVELKKEINEAAKRLGRPAPYVIGNLEESLES